MKISFVIPCYKSANTIEGVVSEIQEVVAKRPNVEYEIIMVSDHSPDNVYQVIERMCKLDPEHLRGVELARNFGQHSALMAGFGRASGDFICTLDDDGQAPVESIYDMVECIEQGPYDVVYGAYPVKKHKFIRNVGTLMNNWMAVWLIGKPPKLSITSFRILRKYVVDHICNYNGPFPYIDGLIYRVTKTIGSVSVNHRERVAGTSGYSFAKLMGLWMNGFTAFSVKPLRFATWMGFVCAGLGFMYGAWTVIKKLFINPGLAIGWSSIMATLMFIGGMLMLITGLIGEYIGRIYICINQSPQYVVSRETDENV